MTSKVSDPSTPTPTDYLSMMQPFDDALNIRYATESAPNAKLEDNSSSPMIHLELFPSPIRFSYGDKKYQDIISNQETESSKSKPIVKLEEIVANDETNHEDEQVNQLTNIESTALLKVEDTASYSATSPRATTTRTGPTHGVKNIDRLREIFNAEASASKGNSHFVRRSSRSVEKTVAEEHFMEKDDSLSTDDSQGDRIARSDLKGIDVLSSRGVACSKQPG